MSHRPSIELLNRERDQLAAWNESALQTATSLEAELAETRAKISERKQKIAAIQASITALEQQP